MENRGKHYLDVNTRRGQVTIGEERDAIMAFETRFPTLHFIHTPKRLDAVNDGIVVKRADSTMQSIVECKCRHTTVDELRDHWKWEWLVTAKKLDRIAFIAREMRVTFTAFVYFTESRMLLIKPLYDGSTDKWLVKPRYAETETRANINGGTAVRENAFINLQSACVIQVPVFP